MGILPWTPPSVSTVLEAVEPAREESPFVFHDPAGRRWSRIKLAALAGAAALVLVGGGMVLALTRVAPGRAPALAVTPSQLVPDWQMRDPGAASPAVPTAAPAPAAPAARTQTSPRPTTRPSPTKRPKPSPTPRRTPTPIPPTPVV